MRVNALLIVAGFALHALPAFADNQAARPLSLPLAFEPNLGQAPSGQFIAHTRGFAVSLSNGNLDLTSRHSHVSASLRGSRGASPIAEDALPATVGYFRGNDPSRWIKKVHTWARVRYHNVYPGIDIVYYGNAGKLEYDFVAAVGADISRIAMRYEGAQAMRITGDGDLAIRTGDGPLLMHKPAVYQEIAGARHVVDCSYVLSGNTARFALGKYDPTRALVIDPSITWATYFAAVAGSTEVGEAMVTDAAGNIYVAGTMVSIYGDLDAFFCKFNAAGTALIVQEIGGSNDDYAHAIAVDATGAFYLAGETDSYDYPADSSYDSYAGYVEAAYISKIDPTAQVLIYSHYFGGSGGESAFTIALDAATNAYIGGVTGSVDMPVSQGAAQTTSGGGYDGFLVEFNAAGSGVYATYFGGSGNDAIYAVAADSGGDIFATGQAGSPNFPVTANAFQSKLNGTSDAFAAKFAPGTGTLVVSTLLGGSADDAGNGIAIDSAGAMYITGETVSADFPVMGAPQSTYGGAGDAFIAKVNGNGQGLAYATYLGGSGEDYGNSIALDGSGNAYITGATASTDFPVAANPLQATNLGSTNGILAGLSADGSTVLFATYLGGDGAYGTAGDYGTAIAYNAALPGLVIVGVTSSDNFPATAGAAASMFQGGQSNAFIAQLSLAAGPVGMSDASLRGAIRPAAAVTIREPAHLTFRGPIRIRAGAVRQRTPQSKNGLRRR